MACERASADFASTFCPTMMIGSSTSCRNVCAIHATMMSRLPVPNAEGALTRASTVNRYAAHIVPTMIVILSPMRALNRAIGPSPCSSERACAVVGGPLTCRSSTCGWGW